jgi:hypothetical protein
MKTVLNIDDNIDAMIIGEILGDISPTEKTILDHLIAGNPAVKERYDYLNKVAAQPDFPAPVDGYATAGQLIELANRRRRTKVFQKWIKWIVGIGLLGWLLLTLY